MVRYSYSIVIYLCVLKYQKKQKNKTYYGTSPIVSPTPSISCLQANVIIYEKSLTYIYC